MVNECDGIAARAHDRHTEDRSVICIAADGGYYVYVRNTEGTYDRARYVPLVMPDLPEAPVWIWDDLGECWVQALRRKGYVKAYRLEIERDDSLITSAVVYDHLDRIVIDIDEPTEAEIAFLRAAVGALRQPLEENRDAHTH